jgi:precorrin-3B synthase
MRTIARAPVRGSCPGALRPMESGDGLIVRVRPHAGRLKLDVAAKMAEAAERFGNGEIDLTRRANLQLRGVTAETLQPLQHALDALGLLDASADAEAARNIVVSPLAGADPTELVDVTPLALALEARLAADPRLWRLPVKFGFVVDGGGMLSLDNERADIRLKAVSRSEIAIGIDSAAGVRWLGSTTAGEAVEVAARVALSFLATQAPGSRSRMSEISPALTAAIALEIVPPLQKLDVTPSMSPRGGRLGVVARGGWTFAVGVAAPFGRVSSRMLIELSRSAVEVGAQELRVSPWRSFYVPVSAPSCAHEAIAAAERLGFITDDADPLVHIDACPGAPACRSASCDTRAIARRVAALMPKLGATGRVHVSGCAKGCACSVARPLVLVGAGDRVAVIRNGRADSAPDFFIPAADIERLPDFLKQELRP